MWRRGWGRPSSSTVDVVVGVNLEVVLVRIPATAAVEVAGVLGTGVTFVDWLCGGGCCR